MIDIEHLNGEIDKTQYWDMPILDIQSKYFNDQICLYVEKNDIRCWKISFLSCYKVNYETDANWRRIEQVQTMTSHQLCYYGQDISVKKYATDDNFIEASLDLSIMNMTIICKNILVEEIDIKGQSFFWQNGLE